MMGVNCVIPFIHWLVLITPYSSTLITENHKGSKLTSVPETLNNNVQYLDLQQNLITNITKTSLVNYPNLIMLVMKRNPLRYIHDESFDNNSKLQNLILNSNKLCYIPASFGLAQHSLIEILMRSAVVSESVKLNFSKFSVLKMLNLGRNPLTKFEASNLPKSLESLRFDDAKLVVMPNFQLYTPKITIISLSGNNLSYIPDEYMMDLQLESVNFRDNNLETIPDLFDQPLQKLQIANNPLRCNESLCWVRLWARKKTVVLTDIKSVTCESPLYSVGKKLLDVDPVKMGCYKGEWLRLSKSWSNMTVL